VIYAEVEKRVVWQENAPATRYFRNNLIICAIAREQRGEALLWYKGLARVLRWKMAVRIVR